MSNCRQDLEVASIEYNNDDDDDDDDDDRLFNVFAA